MMFLLRQLPSVLLTTVLLSLCWCGHSPPNQFHGRVQPSYPASRVSFDLPRKIGKRKETLLVACTFFDPPIIQKHS